MWRLGAFDSHRRVCIVICHSRVPFEPCTFYQAHAEACVLVLVRACLSSPAFRLLCERGSDRVCLEHEQEAPWKKQNLNLNSRCLRQTRPVKAESRCYRISNFGRIHQGGCWVFLSGLGFFEIRADYRHYCFVKENCNQRMSGWNWTCNIS